MTSKPALTDRERAFLGAARRAVLATMGANGRPRLVPICFVVGDGVDALGRTAVYSPLDEKPKSVSDLHDLHRARDLLVLPAATILVDRWDEDWAGLGWLRGYGAGELMEPEPREIEEHARAIEALRAKYPQYAEHGLEGRPIIRIRVDRAVGWGDLSVDG
jgi:PPOX class probable F420-dependent enzyme